MGLILTTIEAATTISTGLYWCAAHAPYDTKLSDTHTPRKGNPMTLDLHAINQRYETALTTHPAKGTPTRKAYLALADSVADVRVLMAEIERLRARLDAVKEIGSEHWNAQIKRESKFGRTGSSCVCEVCNIMRALEGGEQG